MPLSIGLFRGVDDLLFLLKAYCAPIAGIYIIARAAAWRLRQRV